MSETVITAGLNPAFARPPVRAPARRYETGKDEQLAHFIVLNRVANETERCGHNNKNNSSKQPTVTERS